MAEHEHIVSAFEDELKELSRRVSEMGGLVERRVDEALSALMTGDTVKAQHIIAHDIQIDEMQHEIEDKAVLIIARRQPVAQDLRQIVSALRICSDLERIGDLAKNIAKRVVAIEGGFRLPQLVRGLDALTHLALEQVKATLDAFSNQDENAANRVWHRDGEIDALYTSLFREMLTYMMEDPRNITTCTHLLFCAKNMERIGDHATNIAETVVYLVTGNNFVEKRSDDNLSELNPM